MTRANRLTSALTTLGLSEAIRWSRWRASLSLRVDAQATPVSLASLIRNVEREPELVPGVRHVTVLARGEESTPGSAGPPTLWVPGPAWRVPAQRVDRPGYPQSRWTGAPRHLPSWLHPLPGTTNGGDSPPITGWVRYEVHGAAVGIPWTVRFYKIWEDDTRFIWWSEGGTGRPDHYGCLRLQPYDTGTRMELRAATRSALPILGGAATLLVNPLFLGPTFARWLRNLARAVEHGES